MRPPGPVCRLVSRVRAASGPVRALARLRTVPRGSRRPLLYLWTVQVRRPLTGRGLVRRLMHDSQSNDHSRTQHDGSDPAANDAVAPGEDAPHASQDSPPVEPSPPSKPPRLLILVRHGQSSYNVENRMPGQLAGVTLTDEGRRQALRAAVALSGLPLSAVVSSPLERASETAEIIARGWNLPVRTDPRLMDTDVGAWAGQLIADLHKNDPGWKQYVAHPNDPPPGIEGFAQVQGRAMAAVRDLLDDESLGSYIVVVTHADVIKLILADFTGVASESARFIYIANASISALALGDTPRPHLLAVNWTALPAWLSPPPSRQQPSALAVAETQTPTQPVFGVDGAQAPSGQRQLEAVSDAAETQRKLDTPQESRQETSEDADVRPA